MTHIPRPPGLAAEFQLVDRARHCFYGKDANHSWREVKLATAADVAKIAQKDLQAAVPTRDICIKCGMIASTEGPEIMLIPEILTKFQQVYEARDQQTEQKAVYEFARLRALAELAQKYPLLPQLEIAKAGFAAHEALVESLPELLAKPKKLGGSSNDN